MAIMPSLAQVQVQVQDALAEAPEAPSEAAPKRKAPAPDTTNNDRAEKRRASRACLRCRNRKVRCDVLLGGAPCTNCRLDAAQCVLMQTNRGKKAAAATTNTTSTIRVEHSHSPQSSSRDSNQDSGQSPPQSPDDDRADDFPTSLTFERQSDGSGPEIEATNRQLSPQSVHVVFPVSNDLSSSLPHMQGLPRYIQALPPHIKSDDIEYLARKGALTIPDDDLRDHLLRNYVQYVHPFMPALDLSDFITPIVRGDESNPTSLLLFQAVMFVGVAFVDMEYLHQRGYSSRKEARKVFFERVGLLYGLNCESDRLLLIQALLLMTYWYGAPEDEKDNWYWMGVTLSLAQVHGIHRNPEPLKISLAEKQLRKRIWWSCFIRDRVLALGIRRPARIRENDFNVPMLTLDDFALKPLPDDIVRFLGEPSVTRDPETRKTLAMICIGLAKLCVCTGRILETQYSILGREHLGAADDTAIMVMPKNSIEQGPQLARCDADLDEWCQTLHLSCRYRANKSKTIERTEGAKSLIRLHQASLQMIYLTALSALHRPQVFQSASDPRDNVASKRLSRQRVTEAAAAITEIAYDLHEHDQVRFLSLSSIPAFVAATLIHLLDIRSAREEVRNISIGRFYQCMQALQRLQDMYASADHAVLFLENVIQNTNVQIPMLVLRRQHNPARLTLPLKKSNFQLLPEIPHRNGNRYPTPLSFMNHPTTQDSPPKTNGTSIILGEETSPELSNPLSQSVPGNQGSTHESIHVSPPVSDWDDIDMDIDLNMLPALVNFDTDPTFFAMTGEAISNLPWGPMSITGVGRDYLEMGMDMGDLGGGGVGCEGA